ncbi:hypothetical protein N7468_010218 [Penicillium chermesinum]|uniref:tRNA (adenine(58)-N(1))-methyltransferase catalytic subunit TRM61 n=1 Tax=Penicillium chermesinum TaxID=63820 RepID=A0A9W9NCA6_9EURO|nr:uncharacterized protein N7468_010218 [Penicillium chermesinum]KAJ5217210.1 hypothetical protein N7468_010218 [Penicillium chermesinum]KAJ6171174.1 hypothetical protein N7470_000241 [Penicillium chermesinum]
MARLLRSLQRVLGLGASGVPAAPAAVSRSRSIDTDFTIFREGDRAVLHTKNPSLTKPLKHGGKTNLRRGHLEHSRIIGSRVWDAVQAHKGPDTRLSLPTLDEYVTLTPRYVTPIYPHDANLIVSLLDIHVNPPVSGDKQPPLEILESGTGHGSLTLHLARALHAANTIPPPRPSQSQIQYVSNRNRNPKEQESPEREHEGTADAEAQREWDAWRTERGAVIHTVDVSSKFAKLAEQNVQGFRRGIYGGTVDFYVGAVEEWINEQVARRAAKRPVEPFLTCAILDMPSAHERIPLVKDIIKRDGRLVVFAPSITQIGDCVRTIHEMDRAFVMERVVELGTGVSGGRNWDVRLAVKKSASDPSTWNATESEETRDADPEEASEAEDTNEISSAMDAPSRAVDENAVMVCRPKVGLRTLGGGFVGVWRRIEDSR